MDATTERLVDFALSSDFDDLPSGTVHECKRRIIDTFASAMNAYNEPVSRMARAIAGNYSGGPVASVWGSGVQTTPEGAAFANGVMVRFMDVSDTYVGKSRGHPSDVISAIVAVGDALHADGRSVIGAIALAYDVYCSFIDAVEINTRGWDQPVYGVVACAMGAGRLLGLSREQMGNAIALALAPNMALAQTRSGDLSNWKGCAGANAARNGVFAAMLAHTGFSGPTAVFEGVGGLFEVLGRFEWPLPGRDTARMVTRTHIKSLPLCFHGQSAVLAAFELRSRVNPQEISEIRVDTYRIAVAMMAGDASRWAPTTRETADHSLPFVIAVALLDGKITPESFAAERLADGEVARLMRKVKVFENAELCAQYPEGAPGSLTVTTTSGGVITKDIRYPKGHSKNPMSDAELEQKFHDLWQAYGDAQQGEAVLRALWSLDRAADFGRDVLQLFVASAPVQKVASSA